MSAVTPGTTLGAAATPDERGGDAELRTGDELPRGLSRTPGSWAASFGRMLSLAAMVPGRGTPRDEGRSMWGRAVARGSDSDDDMLSDDDEVALVRTSSEVSMMVSASGGRGAAGKGRGGGGGGAGESKAQRTTVRVGAAGQQQPRNGRGRRGAGGDGPAALDSSASLVAGDARAGGLDGGFAVAVDGDLGSASDFGSASSSVLAHRTGGLQAVLLDSMDSVEGAEGGAGAQAGGPATPGAVRTASRRALEARQRNGKDDHTRQAARA